MAKQNQTTSFITKLVRLLMAALAIVGVIAALMFWLVNKPLSPTKMPLEFHIPPGSSAKSVAQVLAQQGAGVQPDLFYWIARASGQARQIKAGSYELAEGETLWSLLGKLTRGDQTTATVTIVEGTTFRQLRKTIAANINLKQDTRALSDSDIMTKLGVATRHPEGQFFPDTYVFAKGASDWDVYRRAYRAMQTQLAAAWEQRDADSPLKTPYEALILASIVEKETGKAGDRGLVGGVFVNRLKIGMLLQTDPTVIYGLGETFDGNLRKRDLQTDTPYNTYTRSGLPPTPISLAGQASLLAAVRPQATKAIYFVARGDGTSQFSETLDAHNRAVNKYQRGQ
jgi:UPF0755 protein